MNAILNINVRVAANQARAALGTVQQGITGVNRAAQAQGMAGFMKHLNPDKLMSFGKNLQWTGRQLEFSFTLPIVAAGAAITKFQLDNERAMVQVRKVYGDGSEGPKQLKGELDALGRSFQLLSSRFGVNQAEVIDIAGAWAQAGSAGVGLAKSVRTTLETMILGEMEAGEAAEGLIAIQSAYRLSSEQLTNVIAGLNAVENATGITLEGLIQVIGRAGGTARTAGISIRELAGYAAAIVPAAGSAAQAGNALRTIISRIMAPTKETSELLNLMGINIMGAAWQSRDATGRIDMLADSFMQLDDAQKTVVSSSVASRWQLNRFDLLMEQIAGNIGFYKRAMEVGGDATVDFTEKQKATADVMQRELLAALQSNPQQLEILKNVLKNTLTEAIQPLIPHLVFLAQEIVNVMTAFTRMSPEAQRFLATAAVMLAVLGPLARYMGALNLLFGVAGAVIRFVVGALFGHVVATDASTVATGLNTTAVATNNVVMARQGGLLRGLIIPMMRAAATAAMDAMASVLWAVAGVVDAFIAGTVPLWGWVALIAAILAAAALLINKFYDGGIKGFIEDVGHAFGQLPGIIGRAFQSVIQVLGRAIEIVRDFLSYLNPFARHSPSLVDNVRAGVGVILSQYQRLRGIPAILSSAISALNRFNEASAPGRRRFQDAEYAEQRADIAAVAPEAVPEADALYAALQRLRPVLDDIGNEVAGQEMTVDHWKDLLWQATNAVDAAELRLDQLRATAETAKNALDNASEALDELRDIKLDGWYAMQDAIFDNEMAQKRLRLEILRMEDAGMSIDDINDKLSRLRGEIEALRGEEMDLRLSGAGSDVLGPIQEQIAALEQLETETMTAGSPINNLQKQLEELQRAGEILDLESSLQFDPLQRQLDAIGQTMAELPFEELYGKIASQTATVDQLEAAWRDADAAVQAQEAVVDNLRLAREELQTTYDIENGKLSALKDSYQAVEDQIRAMEQALNEFASSAKKARDDASMAEQLFAAGEGYNFDDIGGTTDIGREGGLDEINAFNKQMEEELKKALANMGDAFDPLQPIKDGIEKARKYIEQNMARVIASAILAALAALALLVFTGAGGWVIMLVAGAVAAINMYFGGAIVNALQAAWQWVTDTLLPWIGGLFAPVVDVIVAAFSGIGDAFAAVWGFIEPVLVALGEAFAAVFGAVADVLSWWWGDVLSPIFGFVVDIFQGFVLPVLQLFGAIFRIIFETVGNVISWWWNNVTKPVFGFFVDVIQTAVMPIVQLFAAMFQIAFALVRKEIEIVGAVLGWFWREVVSPVFGWVKDRVETVVGAVVGAFQSVWHWLVDTLGPVFQTFGDIVGTVMANIGTVIGNVWEGVKNTISRIWDTITDKVKAGVNFFIRAFNKIADAVTKVGEFLNVDVKITRMEEIDRMHTGGPVQGPWGGPGLRGDETTKILQRGEYVIDKRTAKELQEYGGPNVGKWFKDRGEDIANVAGSVRKGAVTALAQPFLAAADGFLAQIPSEHFRNVGKRVKNDIYDWLKGTDDAGYVEGQAGRGAVPGEGFPAVINWLKNNSTVPFRVTSTLRPFDPGLHGQGRAADFAGPQPGWDSPQLRSIYQAFLPIAGTLNELIYSGPGGGGWKNGSPHRYSDAVIADHHDHVHAALADGGNVLRRGRFLVGENGHEVVDIPAGGRVIPLRDSDLGGREIHFHGDLVFPNVQDGDDAEAFIRNLESLVND